MNDNLLALRTSLSPTGPLGYLPLTSRDRRDWSEHLGDEGFLNSCLDAVLTPGRSGELLAVTAGKVLVDDELIPLNLAETDCGVGLNHAALREYCARVAAHEPRKVPRSNSGEHDLDAPTRADVLFGGMLDQTPVLALCGAWEEYLDLPENLLGPDGQQLSPEEFMAARTGGRWLSLREHADSARTLADNPAEHTARGYSQIFSAVAALTAWHASAVYDGATGEPTVVINSGWARLTPAGRVNFPRTDPAVITAVTATIDGQDHLLLGQSRAWAKNRFSTFAGFVEAGESIENAVAREVFEECGGAVTRVRYLGSQPWPFPRSLMFGFTAEIENPEQVAADETEIETIRWFTRQQLREAHTSGEIQLPPRSSISRALIEDFLGEPLPTRLQ
ncbi:NAD(+) diphosphatase [Rothia sp. LK2588]|uniref:NAD(+) diphosphatase n=1 Tax=Rothia sp. LK2588 TaxID=3114369 RepID=UPI0034CEF865